MDGSSNILVGVSISTSHTAKLNGKFIHAYHTHSLSQLFVIYELNM